MTQTLYLDLLTAFTAGFLGSVHCVAMCGPLAGYGCGTSLSRRFWGGPLWFVTGKLLSYAIVGFFAGAVGGWLLSVQWIPKFSAWIGIVSGALMVVLITYHWLVPASGGVHWSLRLMRPLMKIVSGAASPTVKTNVLPFLLGFCAALLPCGLLHAMVLRAVSSGTAGSGMLMMMAFGIGTSPALLGIAVATQALPVLFRKYANRVGEGLLVIVAISMIVRGVHGLSMPEQCPYCK